MTDLKPKHALALWKMLFLDEDRSIRASELQPADRKLMLEAGLVGQVQRKGPTGRARGYLVATDRAWVWAQDNLDTKLNAAPSAALVLQGILTHLKRHLAEHGLCLTDFVASAESGPATTDEAPIPLETRIRDTYFDFTYGQANIPMPLSTLRSALPGIAANEMDAELTQMMTQPGVILYPEDNPQARTTEMEQGALNLNGAVKHYLKLEP